MSAPTTVTEPDCDTIPIPVVRSHLHQIDLVRLITFSCVILIHVISGVNAEITTNVSAITMVMHFARNTFFFLTGLVLTYQHRNRKPGVFTFWRKRIWVVAVPYVIWSAVYTVREDPGVTLPEFAHQLGGNLLTGSAMYHLYFLVVTIQFYLVFPAFLAALKAMRRRPVLTLAVAVVVQYVMLSFETVDEPPDTDFWQAVWPYFGSVLSSYLVYFVIGGVLALHMAAVTEWVRNHFWGVLGLGALGMGTTLVNYYTNVHNGMDHLGASNALQPSLLIWCVPAVLVVYALGVRWADRRRDGSITDKLLAGGTDRAFGIFLIHPLVLAVIYEAILNDLLDSLSIPVVATVVFLLGVCGTLCVVEVLRRTPWAKQLIGRNPVPLIGPRTTARLRKLVGNQEPPMY